MKASQSLRRPENWPDFETLCKKLWGEIWTCPEIKKNGRSGQAQHGVDVYGVPKGESEYYGIHCKGKDEYTHKQLSIDEIDKELDNAKKFQPQLKKFYFVTTAVKDATIEEYIRTKDIEFRKAGLFEVHLYAWEDIVDLIDENRQTHDWYVNSQNYKSNNSVNITFGNGEKTMLAKPIFLRRVLLHVKKNSSIANAQHSLGSIARLATPFGSQSKKINQTYFPIAIKIKNDGTNPIEDYKVQLNFEGEIDDLSDTNITELYPLLSRAAYMPDTFVYTESLTGKIVPRKRILVGDDDFLSDTIFIKPKPHENRIIIKWKFLSKHFKDEGELEIILEPDLKRSFKTIIVDNPQDYEEEEIEIEDAIVDFKDED